MTWTEADQAELDVLLHEFVDVAFQHKERCTTCAPGQPWCRPLQAAFEAVLDWRRRRLLMSTAAALRAMQDVLDQERNAA